MIKNLKFQAPNHKSFDKLRIPSRVEESFDKLRMLRVLGAQHAKFLIPITSNEGASFRGRGQMTQKRC